MKKFTPLPCLPHILSGCWENNVLVFQIRCHEPTHFSNSVLLLLSLQYKIFSLRKEAESNEETYLEGETAGWISFLNKGQKSIPNLFCIFLGDHVQLAETKK